MWSLEVLKNKYSYQSCASKSSLFAEMFKDSKIVRSFTLGKTKCSYVICCDIAPYCKDLLMFVSERKAFVVILFNEVFKGSIKKAQVNMHKLSWNYSNCQVSNRYLNSEFSGKTSAVNIYEKLDACCFPLDKNKVIQVGYHLVCCFNTL